MVTSDMSKNARLRRSDPSLRDYNSGSNVVKRKVTSFFINSTRGGSTNCGSFEGLHQVAADGQPFVAEARKESADGDSPRILRQSEHPSPR
jgi:hypothetical protein